MGSPPPRINLIVGYPRTPYLLASPLSTVASTLASLTSEPSPFRVAAALEYSGVNALQWPHQGASVEHTIIINVNHWISYKYHKVHSNYAKILFLATFLSLICNNAHITIWFPALTAWSWINSFSFIPCTDAFAVTSTKVKHYHICIHHVAFCHFTIIQSWRLR